MINLPNYLVEILLSIPESGMGYQTIRVHLKDGTVLPGRCVINSSLLRLEEGDDYTLEDIQDITL